MNSNSESAFSAAETGDRRHQFAISLALIGGFVALLCLFLEPNWENNDDVAMSMIAHGYGAMDYGSPNLIFSNVLWGRFVRVLPNLGGVMGYSTATLLSLVIAGATTLYFLLRSGAGYAVSLLAMAIVLARPALLPQFTTTAGLLTIACVLGLRVYACHGSLIDLALGCFLGFVAFLIRNLEFALVFIVALPLLPWRKLLKSRPACIAAATFAVCLTSATVFDTQSYAGPEWQDFFQRNAPRAAFTDFNAADRVLQRPEVMQRAGFSENDVRLVADYFFADPRLMNPASLRLLLGDIPTQLANRANLESGLKGLSWLLRPPLIPLAVTGILLLFFSLRPSLLLVWAAFLIVMFAFGAAGRLGTSWVYVPLLSMLIVIPLASTFRQSQWRYRAVGCVLLGGCIFNSYPLAQEIQSRAPLLQARSIKLGESESVAVWGASLPYQYVFPIFTRESDIRGIRIYGLGTATLAPMSVATADERAGSGFLARLRSRAGIQLIANRRDQSLLDTYCNEHYGVRLKLSVAKQTALWTVLNASCAPE
jgi:hypothetical protein